MAPNHNGTKSTSYTLASCVNARLNSAQVLGYLSTPYTLGMLQFIFKLMTIRLPILAILYNTIITRLWIILSTIYYSRIALVETPLEAISLYKRNLFRSGFDYIQNKLDNSEDSHYISDIPRKASDRKWQFSRVKLSQTRSKWFWEAMYC